jgi:hypothetical protein
MQARRDRDFKICSDIAEVNVVLQPPSHHYGADISSIDMGNCDILNKNQIDGNLGAMNRDWKKLL